MAPKPFPYPFRVGIDVCKVSRITKIHRDVKFRNLWARRVFTRLEWPALLRKYLDTQRLLMVNAQGKLDKEIQDHDAHNFWMLPDFPPSPFDPPPPEFVGLENARDFPAPILHLMRHLAGRYML